MILKKKKLKLPPGVSRKGLPDGDIDFEKAITRKEIQSCFISFALDNDLVDLRSHHYLVYRHPKLKELFVRTLKDKTEKCDTVHPNDLFRYLRKLMRPYYPPGYKQQIVEQVLALDGIPVFKALPPATDPSEW